MIAALLVGACGRQGDTVTASGTIEMDEVDVASRVGGRIVRLAVDEGDTVRAGDTLAVLDQGEIAAELQSSRAEAARALALWRERVAGPRREEIRGARADLAAATARRQLADTEEKRIAALVSQGLAAQATLDRARAEREMAVANAQAAREKLRLLEQGFRREEIQAAREAADAARAQSAAARSRAHELLLTAPIDGVVLLKNAQAGEVVGPNVPVVTLGNPDRLWMRVYVPAPELAKVRLGTRAEVEVEGFGQRRFRGRVVEIATRAEFTPRAALTEEERANLVFGVKIALEPSAGALKPGLPADARLVAEQPPPRNDHRRG